MIDPDSTASITERALNTPLQIAGPWLVDGIETVSIVVARMVMLAMLYTNLDLGT